VLAHAVLEHGIVDPRVGFRDADALGEAAEALGRVAAPPRAGESRQARIVPARDVPALDDLLARYARMDFADATLVLIAEKTGITEIFTIDRRDFEAYRTPSGRRFKLLPA